MGGARKNNIFSIQDPLLEQQSENWQKGVLTSLLLFSCPVISTFVTPWTAARQASLPFSISQGLLKLMSIESMMLSNHLIFCYPRPPPPALNLSQNQGLFQ